MTFWTYSSCIDIIMKLSTLNKVRSLYLISFATRVMLKAQVFATYCDNIHNRGGSENLSNGTIEETFLSFVACQVDY